MAQYPCSKIEIVQNQHELSVAWTVAKRNVKTQNGVRLCNTSAKIDLGALVG